VVVVAVVVVMVVVLGGKRVGRAAPVRKGVGSNPTAVNSLFVACISVAAWKSDKQITRP